MTREQILRHATDGPTRDAAAHEQRRIVETTDRAGTRCLCPDTVDLRYSEYLRKQNLERPDPAAPQREPPAGPEAPMGRADAAPSDAGRRYGAPVLGEVPRSRPPRPGPEINFIDVVRHYTPRGTLLDVIV